MRVARHSFYEATARKRVRGLVDAGSFREFCGPAERVTSPHLPALGLPVAFDDGVVVGEGTMDGRKVLIAAQEGGFMGGAVGEVHGAKITGLLERAVDTRPEAVVLLLDTGGVRLHEANAGLVAMGEIQRAALSARHTGVPVIVAIGGKNGCYGGMSIVARSCDWIVASEEGRLSISGPEVIETVEGIEEFDSQDRALVWRTMGAKHRRLIGEIDALVADDMDEFRDAILRFVGRSRPLDLDALEAEHAMLSRRLERFWDCADGTDVWARLGVNDPASVPSLPADRFNALLGALSGERR
ncbi:biotin-independent malonate decarboxylase subunit beta [Hansschlegelia zhihuaiae]|uniref:Biotin-independent malonate decarboxylase subunit beta n=1 Tax=Hansschlegelia zhihuaiae TaxID=405005 RepID=A0A4Q0M9N9_9HYPH|nr:biotin-independent malonate decarboxylase subunit beta [Hansschlegelia zhihuaiae]RXF69930.1 biotin-independent malonate decarboxylase subunit beta [Hansschlegelia zhihuaiae]